MFPPSKYIPVRPCPTSPTAATLGQAASISPKVVAAAPRWPPRPCCLQCLFSIRQPGGPVKTRSDQGTVCSKPSRGSLLHLEPSPRPSCGSPGLPRSAPHPKLHLSSDLLSPAFILAQAHSCLRALACAVPSHGMLFPPVSTWLSHSSGQPRCHPHSKPSLTTVFKTAGTCVVAQWLRIRLPMQGTQVRALVWEDPT